MEDFNPEEVDETTGFDDEEDNIPGLDDDSDFGNDSDLDDDDDESIGGGFDSEGPDLDLDYTE
ncbi:MAG TPA: hypothetical protein PKX21_01780 [Candidatus Pacearchaeota archaeon]|nr:hypothetical protein [Candidatus Pacearchaeota archaeon]